jgi:hypothetical protein
LIVSDPNACAPRATLSVFAVAPAATIIDDVLIKSRREALEFFEDSDDLLIVAIS